MREEFMTLALNEARAAFDNGEVPVGCVIVDKNGKVIGRGRNRREEKHDASAHAEIEAIRDACRNINDWRLEGCEMYVTLEPCPMCAGAVLNSRIPVVVFGARDEVSGSLGSVVDLFFENYNYKARVIPGVMKEESSALLKSFFEARR